MAYELLEKAVTIDRQINIDEKFLLESKIVQDGASDKGVQSIEDVDTLDLVRKAREKQE
jgi:hypothetical protein